MGLNIQQGDPILEIKELRKFYPVRRKFGGGKGRYVHAVDDVSLTIGRGQTHRIRRMGAISIQDATTCRMCAGAKGHGFARLAQIT
jgi:ABC-type microcin C transport system duplicated ATPase subunit YejF